ncbi:MAG: C39 family peptidase [Chloroflexi bacterium]|nr:C39 family peptidase [Chloroflexota bacterium]
MLPHLLAALFSAALLVSTALPTYAALGTTDGDAATAAVGTPPSASLGPLSHIVQTMNNCGPASVAEVLGYWGVKKTQGEVQAVLRADGNPGGMSPFGMPSYARSFGLSTLMGAGGSDDLVKAFIANGLPVIVSQWVSLGDHYGHYRPIQAYDDQRGVFISSDPYLGDNHAISYNEFDAIWASNNDRFYVIYPPSKQPVVDSIVAAAGWDPTDSYMADIAIQQARLSGGVGAPAGWGFRAGYSALSMAWDNLQLGDYAATQRALGLAAQQHTSPVLTNWIAGEMAYRQGRAA